MSVETIYICCEHGVGHNNCCKQAEEAGWMEIADQKDSESTNKE